MSDDLLWVRIARRQLAAPDIVELELVDAQGGTLPPFEAGAHVDVMVAPGLVRQYSLCGDPAERHRYRLGVLRDPASRGGSQELHRAFQVGSVVHIGRPRNNFPLAAHASAAVLLAGGIGITPLLSMAHALHAAGRPFALHYCTRSAGRAAFGDELRSAAFASSVHLHADDDATRRFSLAESLAAAPAGAHLYVCGPTGFIRFVTEGAAAAGWAPERVHVEHFQAAVDTRGEVFRVEARASGLAVDVAPGTTVAQALLTAGVPVVLSCEQGICGTCLVPVLEGVPDHRDEYQTDGEKAANTHMTPCCSRSRTRVLVLDV